VCILGHGTAGLVNAIMLKGMFPSYDVTVVYSKTLGIIGVGEGSTEHWRLNFQDPLRINAAEMVKHCAATHKYGIYFEDWTKHGKNYFHSISGQMNGPNYFAGNYAFALENGWPLTSAMLVNLYDNTVMLDEEDPHRAVNQFHFDTFKLNEYLDRNARNRGVMFVEGQLADISRNVDSGFIEAITTSTGLTIEADFFIDASGFNRALMSRLVEKDMFVDYGRYLPCDSAAVFPTPADESGEIRPYTRARALPNGWMWEIPTQERRGNGYVFSSAFCSDERAVRELSMAHGRNIEPARIIRYKSGYFYHGLAYNCAAVGLASSFVEPLEATSIGSTIQQARMISSLLPTFGPHSFAQSRQYQKQFHSLMENILTMIALHYISDRDDSDMWRAQQTMPLPPVLAELLELWNERCPEQYDVPQFGYEMFQAAHLWHVAQGQGVLNPRAASIQLSAYNYRNDAARQFADMKANALKRKLVPHASLFAQK
jgi:tryptophan halogenase